MESLKGIHVDEPWFEDYLSTVHNLLEIKEKKDKLLLDRNTLFVIAESLTSKMKLVSESAFPLRPEHKQSEDDLSSDSEDGEQPEEDMISESEEKQPEEDMISESEEKQPEEDMISESEEKQPEEDMISESEEKQPEEDMISESEEKQPEEDMISESEEKQPEEDMISESEEKQPEEKWSEEKRSEDEQSEEKRSEDEQSEEKRSEDEQSEEKRSEDEQSEEDGSSDSEDGEQSEEDMISESEEKQPEEKQSEDEQSKEDGNSSSEDSEAEQNGSSKSEEDGSSKSKEDGSSKSEEDGSSKSEENGSSDSEESKQSEEDMSCESEDAEDDKKMQTNVSSESGDTGKLESDGSRESEDAKKEERERVEAEVNMVLEDNMNGELGEVEKLLQLFPLCQRAQEGELLEKRKEIGKMNEDWKVVGCLIMTFKLTVSIHDKYLYSEEYNPKLAILCSEFFTHAIKAAAVFIKPYCGSDPSVKLNEIGEEALKNLGLIIIVVPKIRGLEIIHNVVPVMLESLFENHHHLIKVFFNCLMSHQRTSLPVSIAVLKHFCDTEFLRKFSQVPPEKVGLLLSVLNIVIKFFSRVVGENIMCYEIKTIIKNSVFVIPTVEKPSVIFSILKSIFLMLHKKKSNSVNCMLQDSLTTVFTACNLWLLTPVESKTFCVLLETILVIASSFLPEFCRFLLPYTEILIYTVVFSSKESSELYAKALLVLDNFMANVDLEFINFAISKSLKDDFLKALYEALRSPVASVKKIAFNILGKLGSYSRDNFKNAPKLPESECNINLIIKIKEGCINFPLARVIDIACKNVCSEVDISRKKQALSILRMVILSYIGSFERHSCTNRHLIDISEAVDAINPKYCNVHKKCLMAIFVALEIPDLSKEIKHLIKKVEEAFIRKAKETDDHVNLLLLTDAAIDAVCLPKDSAIKVEVTVIKSVVISIANSFEKFKGFWATYFSYIMERAVNLCHQSTWEAKVVGCKMLQFLPDVFKDWMFDHTRFALIIKSLIYAVADIQEKISFGSSFIIKEIANDIIDKFFQVAKSTRKHVHEIECMLIRGAISHSYFIRKEMRNVMEYMWREKKIKINNLPYDIFYNASDVALLYEDFDFALKYINSHEILKQFREKENFDPVQEKKLYKDLKTICVLPQSHAKAHDSAGSRCTRIRCGALNAIILIFFSKDTSSDFEICMTFSHSPIESISEVGFKCLQHINVELIQHIIKEEEWEDKKFNYIKRLICNEQFFHQSTYYMELFHSWFQEDLWKLELQLMKHFNSWRKSIIQLFRKNKISMVSPHFIIGAQIINLLSQLTNMSESHIRTVISLTSEPEFLKCGCFIYSTCPLKDAFMKFCKRYPCEATSIIIDTMHISYASALLEELWKDGTLINFLTEEKIIEIIKKEYEKALHILCHIPDDWFTGKETLMKELLTINEQVLSAEKHISRKELKVISKCLFCFCNNRYSIDCLFKLTKVFTSPFSHFEFLEEFFVNKIITKYDGACGAEWCARAFLKFHSLFLGKSDSEYIYFILRYIIIPSCFEIFVKKKESATLSTTLPDVENEDRQRATIYNLYFECLKDIFQDPTRHSEKVILLFFKLSVFLCVWAKEETSSEVRNNFNNLKEFVMNVVKTEKNNIFGLLLFVFNFQENYAEILKDILTTQLIQSPQSQYAVCIALSRVPTMLCECLKSFIINRKNFDMKGILNLIVIDHSKFKKLFYVQLFVEQIVILAVEEMKVSESTNDEEEVFSCRRKAVNLIEIVIRWCSELKKKARKEMEKDYSKIYSKAFNCLFRIACVELNCFVQKKNVKNSVEESFTKKCISLLETMFYRMRHLEFDKMIGDLLKKISEEPECSEYRKYEVFKLTVKLFDHMPIQTVKSFVNYFQENFKALFDRSNPKTDKLLEDVCSFLTKLLIKFPPKMYQMDFDNLYKQIETIFSDKHLLLKETKCMLLEAVGLPSFPSCLNTSLECITYSLEAVIQNYPNFGVKTVLSVSLEFLKKSLESAVHLKNEERKLLLTHTKLLISLVENVCHADIMLKIIDIINLCINCLPETVDNSCKTAFKQIFTLVLKVYHKVVSNVDFLSDRIISIKFFEVIINLRKYISIYIEKERNLRVNADYADLLCKIDEIIYTSGMFSNHPEILHSFFRHLYHQYNLGLHYKLFSRLIFIERERERIHHTHTMDRSFSVKLWIHLCIFVMYRNGIFFLHGTRVPALYLSQVFSSVIYLCYADDILSKFLLFEVFPQLWNLLDEDKKKVLFNEMKEFLKSLSNETENSLKQNEVFINSLLRCDIEFAFYVNPKYIHRSLNSQIYCYLLLQEAVFSQRYVCSEIRPVVNEIFALLEESDLYYCFNESFIHSSYKTLDVPRLQKNKVSSTADDTDNLCFSHFIKCAYELTKWSSDIDSQPFVRNDILSKWDIKKFYPPESLKQTCSFCEWKERDDLLLIKKRKEIASAIRQCIRAWETLPDSFPSYQQYSLLQSIEQLTELSAALNLLQCVNSETFLKQVNITCHDWHQHRYLLSDECPFLIDLFHVRRIFFQKILKKIQEPSPGSFVNIIDKTLVHEINDTHLESGFTAHKLVDLTKVRKFDSNIINSRNLLRFPFHCTRFLLKDITRSWLSMENDFSVKRVWLLMLLSKVKSSDLNDKEEEHLMVEEYKLISLSCRNLSPEKRQILHEDKFQIEQEFNKGFDKKSLFSYLVENERTWRILSDIHKKEIGRSNVKSAYSAFKCMLKACKFASASTCFKLIPNLLHLLVYEEEDGKFAKALQEYSVCSFSWVPFLPFLVSHLYQSMKEEKKLLSNALITILIKVAEWYPQQVFVSLQFIPGSSELKETGRIAEIENQLYERHPSVICKLREIMKIVDEFATPSISFLSVYRQLLDKAYNCVFQNLIQEKNVNDPTEIIRSFEEMLTTLELLSSKYKEASRLKFFSRYIENLREIRTPASIINSLKESILFVSKTLEEELSLNFSLLNGKKLQLLSNFHVEDVCLDLFGQSTVMDTSSHVRIHKLLPEVVTLLWDNKKILKISFLGSDGKVYPYLVSDDFLCRKETLMKVKLIQFLENLNPLLDEYVGTSKQFLKWDLPRITPMGSYFILVPYNSMIPYHDIYQKCAVGSQYFSADMYFSQLFKITRSGYTPLEKSFVKRFYDSITTKVPEDIFHRFVNTYYTSPIEIYTFRSQFLKHISMLMFTSQIFKISVNQLLVSKTSGLICTHQLDFSLDNRDVIDYLTPNIKRFIGPFGHRVIFKNFMCISECLKANQRVVQAMLHLVKKEYLSRKESEKMDEFVSSLYTNLNCISDIELEEMYHLITKSDFLCRKNPLVQPWF